MLMGDMTIENRPTRANGPRATPSKIIFSTVLFATDHAGYVIPEIGPFPNSNSLPANSPIGNLPQYQAGPLLSQTQTTETAFRTTTPARRVPLRRLPSAFRRPQTSRSFSR